MTPAKPYTVFHRYDGGTFLRTNDDAHAIETIRNTVCGRIQLDFNGTLHLRVWSVRQRNRRLTRAEAADMLDRFRNQNPILNDADTPADTEVPA